MNWTVSITGPGKRRKSVPAIGADATEARNNALENNPGYDETIDAVAVEGSGR